MPVHPSRSLAGAGSNGRSLCQSRGLIESPYRDAASIICTALTILDRRGLVSQVLPIISGTRGQVLRVSLLAGARGLALTALHARVQHVGKAEALHQSLAHTAANG